MKKILAFALAIVMTFSMAVLPAGAALEAEDITTTYYNASADIEDAFSDVEDIYGAVEEEDYATVVESSVSLLKVLFRIIHGIVHGLGEIFDYECPFCDGDFDFNADDKEEESTTEEPTTEEPTTEEPTTEEPTTEEPTTEEPTTEEPTTEEPTTEEPTTEEPTTEEPTTEEPTTEEPTTEEPTTEEPTTEEPTTQPLAEYYISVGDRAIASDLKYNYTSNQVYAMYAKVGLKFTNKNYKANTVTIKNMATAYVETAILIDAESKGIKEIVFTGTNSFHGNGGNFKLIVNNSGVPVKVKLNSTTKVGSTVLTASNVGNYIDGPYTVA